MVPGHQRTGCSQWRLSSEKEKPVWEGEIFTSHWGESAEAPLIRGSAPFWFHTASCYLADLLGRELFGVTFSSQATKEKSPGNEPHYLPGFATSLQLRYFLVISHAIFEHTFFLKNYLLLIWNSNVTRVLYFTLYFTQHYSLQKKIRVLIKVKNYHTDGDWNITKAGRPWIKTQRILTVPTHRTLPWGLMRVSSDQERPKLSSWSP